jgi:hypothetical protein
VPEQNGGILAAILIALVALTVGVAWTMWPDRGPSVDVSIRRAAADSAVRHDPGRLPCPDRGRGTGAPNVAWPAIEEPDPAATTVRGQAIPFEILLTVPDDGAERDRAAFDVVLTPFRDRGPAAFDPEQDLVCAFVDTDDPVTADAGSPASVEVDADGDAAGARLTVSGLDPGDRAVIEAWAVVTASGTARTGSATASLRSRSVPEGRRIVLDDSTARIPIEFGTDAGEGALTVSIDDGDIGGAPGERLPYEIVVRNPQPDDAVNDLRIVAVPSDLTPVESFVVAGDGADVTTCELEEGPPLLRCATSHLAPDQSVQIRFPALIADVATPQWLREEGPCTPEDSDICMRVEVTWTAAGRTVDSLVASDPAAVLGVHPSIGLAKYALPDPSGPGGTPTVEYSVISAITAPLAEVVVRDEGCTDVVLEDGDTDQDDLLDEGEEWRYRCRGPSESVTTTRAVVRAVREGVSVGDVAVVGG